MLLPVPVVVICFLFVGVLVTMEFCAFYLYYVSAKGWKGWVDEYLKDRFLTYPSDWVSFEKKK